MVNESGMSEELEVEYKKLTKDWLDMVKYAEESYKNGNVEDIKNTVLWLINHNKKVTFFNDKLESIYDSTDPSITWN